MSLPRRPDVITSVFLKPSLRASGPIISCAPGPSMRPGERVELLDRERLEKFVDLHGGPSCITAWIGPDASAATAFGRKTVAGVGPEPSDQAVWRPTGQCSGGGGNVPSDLGGYGTSAMTAEVGTVP